MFACGRVRHADGRSQGRTRQAESVYRRARVSVEGPASHVFIRGRTVPEDALLETHRMRDGSWRRRSMEQAHRQEPLAQRLESDTIRAQRLRFVPVLSELRNHLRRPRSEDHTSELQSLMRNSYAVFCLKQKQTRQRNSNTKKQTKDT